MNDHQKPEAPQYREEGDGQVHLGYEGSEVSGVMRIVYLAFLIWCVYYLIANGVPSLKEWLTNPPRELF